MKQDNYNEFIEIVEKMIEPGKIIEKKYEATYELLTIQLSDIESVRKILFIISPCLRRNNEIPLFTYVKTKTENNEIREKKVFIKLNKIVLVKK